MKLTLAGKLVALLVFGSILYFAWTRFVPPEMRARVPLPPPLGGGQGATDEGRPTTNDQRPTTNDQRPTTNDQRPTTNDQRPTTGDRPPSTNGAGAAGAPTSVADNEILFITTAAKRDWVQLEVERFNAAQGGKWKITPHAIPSREAMHAILEKKVQPVLWSPGGAMWPARLAEAWRERHSSSVLDTTDPNAYRVFLRSPLVFFTTREKATFLRPLLGGARPWAALRELSIGTRKTPWGRFSFSHADPLTSSSGMLTLGLILNEYNDQGGDPAEVAEGPAFARYLAELERSLIYDEAAVKGTTALTNAFLKNMTSYDVITGYESAALEAAASKPNLAVIYPTPTAFSEHAISLLNGDWVTEEQRAGALAFLEFLGGEEAQADGLRFSFRPTRTSSLSLDDRLRTYRAQGFRPSVTSIDLPPYRALNSAAYMFRVRIAEARRK
jgi:hypothetical protein